MMNLSRMSVKRENNRNSIKKVMRTAMGVTVLAGMLSASVILWTFPAAAEGVNPSEAISIEKPSGWKQGSTDVRVTVDGTHLADNVSIVKVEAKVGDSGWQDITSNMSVTISQNTTVYIRVTDSDGNIYEQNRSIRCYDTEKPTLSASLTDGILTIQGQDAFSGISKITVNGAEYSDLKDGMLVIQMTQKDFTTKKIEITGTDGAGNVSDTYSLQNPYYDWAVKQAIAQQADSSKDLSTTSGSAEESEVTSPLPQSATASDPSEARGTVEDFTVTGIEQELAERNETVETISSATTEGGKEFYTISTKSGKVFYLIIDKESNQDNVYFLTEVDNEDLMNFTLSDTATLPNVDTVYATVEESVSPTPVPEVTTESETAQEEIPETEKEVTMPGETSKAGNYLMIGLLCAGVFAGAYYFKIYKPKQDVFDEDEYEEEYADVYEPQERREDKVEYLDDEEETVEFDYEKIKIPDEEDDE